MLEIDPSLPSEKFLWNTALLSQSNSSLLLQLRTGHIPLNSHLYCIGKSKTMKCPHCPSKQEMVYHFLILCLAYKSQRTELKRKLGRGARSLRNLLSHQSAIPHLTTFVRNSGQLKETFGL
ncbi:hypothetical protein K439DRAFT_1342494 [Ramaria rubella]|nr:hypothetical protein K439DRAFT_1342494 [Ramaria rubella]